MNVAQESIVVAAPITKVYEHWLRFEELPKFIKPLREVQRIDDTHFSFKDGDEKQTIVEIIFRNPERRIAWRTISDGVGLGVVSFEPHRDGGTEITLKLRSAFNPFLSPERATEYLREFKKLIEASPHS